MPLRLDAIDVMRGLTEISRATRDGLTAAGRAAAQELEADAKQSAPWTDRTGRARRTLSGFSQTEPGDRDTFYVGVSGAMPYSPALELLHGKRYAVLAPVVEKHTPQMMNKIREVFWRMEGILVERS